MQLTMNASFVPSRVLPAHDSERTFLLPMLRVLNGRDRTQPSARSGHAAVADDANMYVYGGYTNSHGSLGNQSVTYAELWVYNFSTCRWTLVQAPGIPETAASATLKLWNNKLSLYGGTAYPFGAIMSNSLFVCHIDDDFRWEHVRTTSTTTPTAGENTVDTPMQAYGQGVTCHNGDMYVFGGAVGLHHSPISHLHRLCFDNRKSSAASPRWEYLQDGSACGLHGRYRTEIIVDPVEDRCVSKQVYETGQVC